MQTSSKHREIIITVVQEIKATRGTKRLCQACETHFYDLARGRIVCPSCGEEYKAAARPIADLTHIAAPTGKTGWRRKGLKLSKPTLPANDQDESLPEAASSDAVDDAEPSDTGPDDDLVLKQEPDDGHFSGLVERVKEPRER